VERSRLMADDRAFSRAGRDRTTRPKASARVPDAFRARQWISIA
jgi:hypothetical protein